MKSSNSLLCAALLGLFAATTFAAEHAAAPAVAKPDVVKGAATFAQNCASCHNADGNASTASYPKLAQQHPEYLIKQLQEFKSGKRASAVMSGFASSLSNEDMKNIAYWLAGQKTKPGFAKDKELVALGERIYRGGLVDRQIAACASCHGPSGAGIPSQYPRVSGQHAEYTAAQLVAFRDGARKNGPQMAQVAAKLSDKEIRAVADYMAGLR